jgi:hypothetical protein
MTSSSTALRSVLFLLAAATSIAFAKAPPPRDDDPARISVTAVAGDVAVTMAGTATDVGTDSTVNLPARIVTGSDGMLGLTQAGTNITVARDTDVEIPAEAVDGNLVARLVQHRGNVFYDVAHRDVGKLRVETPYLVAVIKGTQFNVAVQQDSTTISLFEGRLEIRTPDGSETIQLNAGEIAIRSSTDGAIRVLGMNDQRVAAPRAASPALGSAAATVQPDQTPAATASVGGVAGNASAGTTTLAANLDLTPSVAEQKNDGGGSERPTVHIASGLDLAVDGNAGLDAQASVDLGIASAGLGVAVESSGVDAALSAKVDLGAANVGVGVNAGVDLGAVSLGGVATDVQLGASLDLGGGTAGVALDTGLSLGGSAIGTGVGTGVDLGAGAGIDLGGGSLNADVGVGLDLGGVVADVGAGIDLSGGTANLGVDLGGASVGVGTGGLGIDLGATDNVVALPVAPIVPVIEPVLPPVLGGGGGGLLGGLLGRH